MGVILIGLLISRFFYFSLVDHAASLATLQGRFTNAVIVVIARWLLQDQNFGLVSD